MRSFRSLEELAVLIYGGDPVEVCSERVIPAALANEVRRLGRRAERVLMVKNPGHSEDPDELAQSMSRANWYRIRSRALTHLRHPQRRRLYAEPLT